MCAKYAVYCGRNVWSTVLYCVQQNAIVQHYQCTTRLGRARIRGFLLFGLSRVGVEQLAFIKMISQSIMASVCGRLSRLGASPVEDDFFKCRRSAEEMHQKQRKRADKRGR